MTEQFFTPQDIQTITKEAGLEKESNSQLQSALERAFYKEMLHNGQLPEAITPEIAERMIERGKMKAELYGKEEQGREPSEQFNAWNTLAASTPESVITAVQDIRMRQITDAMDNLIRSQVGQGQDQKAKQRAEGILRQGKTEELVKVIITHTRPASSTASARIIAGQAEI